MSKPTLTLIKRVGEPAPQQRNEYRQSVWSEALMRAVERYEHPAFFDLARCTLTGFIKQLDKHGLDGGAMMASMTMDSVSDLELITDFLIDHARVVPEWHVGPVTTSPPWFLRIRMCRDFPAIETPIVPAENIDESVNAYLRSFRSQENDTFSPLRQSVSIILDSVNKASMRKLQFHQAVVTGGATAPNFRFWILTGPQTWEVTFAYRGVIREYRKFLNLIGNHK